MPPINQDSSEVNITKKSTWYTPLCQVTSTSKIFAAVLMIILPFAGFYLGYQLAPEKVMEIMVPVEIKTDDSEVSSTNTSISGTSKVNQADRDTSTSTVVTAYITNIDLNHSGFNGDPLKITLDYFDILSGAEGARVLVDEGKCSKDTFDNGWSDCYPGLPFIDHNANPELRTFYVSFPVQVFDDRGNTISIKELDALYIDVPFSVTINEKGEVSKIEQQFRP